MSSTYSDNIIGASHVIQATALEQLPFPMPTLSTLIATQQDATRDVPVLIADIILRLGNIGIWSMSVTVDGTMSEVFPNPAYNVFHELWRISWDGSGYDGNTLLNINNTVPFPFLGAASFSFINSGTQDGTDRLLISAGLTGHTGESIKIASKIELVPTWGPLTLV